MKSIPPWERKKPRRGKNNNGKHVRMGMKLMPNRTMKNSVNLIGRREERLSGFHFFYCYGLSR
jgi:hypothetical protein